MKILSFSLDQQLFKKDSPAAVRLAGLSKIVEQADFVVPSQKKTVVALTNKVTVFGSGGQTKILQWSSIYLLGRTLIKDRSYDLLTVQDTTFLALIAVVLSQIYSLPLEVQVHGFEKENWIRKIISYFVLSRASGVRVVSQRLKNKLVSQYNVISEKIYIIPIVSPILNRKPVEERIWHTPPRLLSIGRLVPVKGFHYLIEAATLLDRDSLDFELTIVGGGGEYHRLEKLIKTYGLEQKVRLKDPTFDLAELYKQADLFVISSLAEGYSLVATEAASFGLPIVMTDVGLAGELLTDNQSAKVVPVGSARKLAEAIKSLLVDQNLRQRLGQAAFVAVKNLPGEEETLLLYKQAWAKLL